MKTNQLKASFRRKSLFILIGFQTREAILIKGDEDFAKVQLLRNGIPSSRVLIIPTSSILS